MENPRPAKVAVVNEVREKLSSSDGAILTEYRGLNVTELANLRRQSQHLRQRRSMLQRSLAGPLNHGSIRHGIAEWHT